jgi:phenylacetic acid degradation operon negative regulatory protein
MSDKAISKAERASDRRRPRAALGQILDQLRGEPSRTWSIIITVYGDAIAPRGGSVWLGTLLAFFKALDISGGVVRTAMSRLASDGWLERSRVGRNSFYRLAEKGRATFAEATRHIYAARPPNWAGYFDLVLLSNGPERDIVRSALELAGLGSPTAGVWVAPGGSDLPAAAQGALKLAANADISTLRELAARSWPLAATAEAYLKFIATFEPMRAALDAGGVLGDLDALAARILLIHEYRRIVLRDPILPVEVLSADWPGGRARILCANLYKDLAIPSERWLDAHAVDETGAPLRQAPEVFRRFSE